MNIVEALFQSADRSAVAVIEDDAEFTYGQLFDFVNTAAQQMKAAGLFQKAGIPRVGLFCPNGIAHVVLALAVVRSGGCLVPIATELAPQEREALIESTALDAIVIAPETAWEQPPGRIAQIELAGFCAAVSILADPKTAFDANELSKLDPAFIRFSSGTTGCSKGVVLSHRTLLDRINAANRGLRIGPEDRVIWTLSMAHHFAVSIMLYLMKGATTVLVSSHLAEDVLAAARQHRGTVIYGAPFHHALLAAEPSGLAWPSLRLAVSTAAALPSGIARDFDSRFGVPLSQALGIIEVGLPVLNVDAPREKPESVGRPQPDFDVELRDESGVCVKPGGVGEIVVRGPGIFDAYLKPWRTRDAVLDDGWFHTGDLGTFDADGFLKIVGRLHSVINVAGMKCFPEEIEAVLSGHPGIRAARVVGKPHPRFGAVPVAEVVARDPANPPDLCSVLARCRDALARFKVPVDVQFVDSLPKTASGKIRR